ncbi:MAG: DUF72 domain-containing protein [Verrucomicrobiota bacterium]
MTTMAQAGNGKILVGTASWTDPGFVAHWYPRKMPAHERLAWYAEQFEMVEVNSTFYSVPDPRTVERWAATTPDHFTFDVKLHQLFSFHSTPAKLLPPALQRLAKIDEKGRVQNAAELQKHLLKMFLGSISILKDAGKLGALLLQLSPAFSPRKHELSELEPLLVMLRNYAVAIELRNRNWATGDQLEATREFLRRNKAIFVNVDAPSEDHFTILPPDLNEVTNPTVAYLRLHGRDAKAYTTGKTVAARFHYDYSDDEIAEVAKRSKRFSRDAKKVHVVFNNNALDYAPRAAARLRTALGQIVTAPPQTPELF